MFLLHLIAFFVICTAASGDYSPDWPSLDKRPLPQWYDEAKIGIFIVWGVYSVPSFGSEWFWERWETKTEEYVEFMEKNYRPNFTYQDFAAQFTAEFFDPGAWVDVFNASGARYIVFTTKHHDGYTLWPSNNSWNWNSLDVGPKRDLVGDLSSVLKSKAPGIHLGLYHSLFEWYNPLYLADKAKHWMTNDFVMRKTYPELIDLVNSYHPDIVWSDGDWEAPDWYWNSTVFLSWLFNDSPVKDSVVVNDRWGIGDSCKHGSFFTCQDRYNPGVLKPYKWENAMTLDKASWGYRREAAVSDYLTIEELLYEVISTISCRGNILINVGPTYDGRIPTIMEERLRQLGSWLDINGAAIYETKPWEVQNDTETHGVWYTAKNTVTYAITLQWPVNNTLLLGSVDPSENTYVYMLGYGEALQYVSMNPGLKVTFPDKSLVKGQWAWAIEMTEVTPVH